MPMNPEIKARWTAALRSGEYPQAKAFLRIPEGFCCLGVLCDLAVKHGIITQQSPDVHSFADRFWEYGDEGNELDLPQAVVEWAGLDGANPNVGPDLPDGARTGNPDDMPFSGPNLAMLNDNGTPFAVIADIIDAQL